MKLKEEFHKKEKVEDLFILTYSKENNKSNYLVMLKNALIKKGYVLTKRNNNEIYEKLKETSEDKYIVDFINRIAIPFISYFKRSSYNIEEFKNLLVKDPLLSKQIKVMSNIYLAYQEKLKELNLIDFEDMINYAYDVDTYTIWADMMIYNTCFYEIERKYYVGYVGRRLGIDYELSDAEVADKYREYIKIEADIPQVLFSVPLS